jgi:hypothetical protein
MNRRHLLTSLAATAAINLLPSSFAEELTGQLTIDPTITGPQIPLDYIGLSYETAQMANPAFFSAENQQLIGLFRELTPTGVLRLGGGSSEFTTYDPAGATPPPPFEVFGPDTSKTIKTGTTNTPQALHNLRGFLDSTNWKLIWGLNLGQGTILNAVAEAAAVYEILGPRLIAFQIGNEPDSFRNRYRPASYAPDDYIREWNSFHIAIQAKVPGAKFAGPDISNKLPYFMAFASEAVKHQDVILLTAHAYAMGPSGSPDSTIENLLTGNPRLQTQSEEKLDLILAAAKQANLPYRMSEGNSCWDGGKAGVSDTLASALWCIDYMLHIAQRGVAGVNLHGGGNGFYTPIAGAPSTGFTRRPEYFGIQFFTPLSGGTFLRTELSGTGNRMRAYAVRNSTHRFLVMINTSDDVVSLTLPGHIHIDSTATQLTGPALNSQMQPVVQTISIKQTDQLRISPRSANMYTF